MSADFAHPDLDLLCDDVIAAALPFLPAGADASILGVELDRRPTLALLVPVDNSAPRAVTRLLATREHAEVVNACEALAVQWLNTLPEATRIACGYATARRGAHLRVYVGRDTHELALAIADGRRIVELAHRTLADATELH